MSDQNIFGGGNKHSLYVPMSEYEQEVIHRLVANKDLVVEVKGWGILENPVVMVGDKRVKVTLPMSFNGPAVPVPVYYFDLELRTRSGLVLFAERHATIFDKNPIQIADGVEFVMEWDIAISHLDPELVKQIKPGATGLTSRVLDRDTGKATFMGNMKLSTHHQQVLSALRAGEARVRKINKVDAQKAAKAEKENS